MSRLMGGTLSGDTDPYDSLAERMSSSPDKCNDETHSVVAGPLSQVSVTTDSVMFWTTGFGSLPSNHGRTHVPLVRNTVGRGA